MFVHIRHPTVNKIQLPVTGSTLDPKLHFLISLRHLEVLDRFDQEIPFIKRMRGASYELFTSGLLSVFGALGPAGP